jgi:hypothetical protein
MGAGGFWKNWKLVGFESHIIALFLQTMIDNPPSNFTWSSTQSIPMKDIKKRTTSIPYTSVSTTQSPKRATDWSPLKIGDYFSADEYEPHNSLCKIWSRVCLVCFIKFPNPPLEKGRVIPHEKTRSIDFRWKTNRHCYGSFPLTLPDDCKLFLEIPTNISKNKSGRRVGAG